MLEPILALISWSLLVWLWMYVVRIPAMSAANIDADDARHPGSLDILPSPVRQVADNYNHLHEQPTIFYALVLCAAVAGAVDWLQLALAWGYVGIRIVHSLIQAIRNPIFIRFLVFALGSVVLFAFFVRTVYLIL